MQLTTVPYLFWKSHLFSNLLFFRSKFLFIFDFIYYPEVEYLLAYLLT